MRFCDFALDVKETSSRISQRNPHFSEATIVQLTIRTLMRPDLVNFFDSLAKDAGIDLPDARVILYYAATFAYIANTYPRPGVQDIRAFSQNCLARLSKLDMAKEGSDSTLSAQKTIPQKFLQIFRRSDPENFYCAYTMYPPKDIYIKSLCSEKCAKAVLIFYKGDFSRKLDTMSGRIIYNSILCEIGSDVISCVYISSLSQ